MHIDTHCHLTHCFSSSVTIPDETLTTITYLIDVSISPSEILSLYQKSPHKKIKNAFGFYPELCETWNHTQKAQLHRWIEDLAPIAIGEIGLDYHHNYGTPELQKRLFIDQLEIASLHRKPVLIHSREAFEDTFTILSTYPPNTPIILHCFGYGPQELEKFLSLTNILVSFAGNITYPSALSLREAIRLVPKDKLLLETDAPYLSPIPMRGKPNRPSYITYIYHFVADWLGMTHNELCAQIQQNFLKTFPL